MYTKQESLLPPPLRVPREVLTMPVRQGMKQSSIDAQDRNAGCRRRELGLEGDFIVWLITLPRVLGGL